MGSTCEKPMTESAQMTAKPIYPYHEWDVVEAEFRAENNYRNETIFALGNGYLGMRGTFEEGYAGLAGTGLEGTYINGFYDTETIKYPEIAYGYAERSQTMLNVTNGKVIKLYLEDEAFSMLEGTLVEYDRTLRLRTGILERKLIWRSPKSREVQIHIKRLVSLTHRHLAAISYEVTPLNFSGEIQLVSCLNGDVMNLMAEDDPRIGSGLHERALLTQEKVAEGSYGALVQRTLHTQFVLACAMEHQLNAGSRHTIENATGDMLVSTVYRIEGQQGQPIQLTKYLGYTTSRDVSEREVLPAAREAVTLGLHEGFERLESDQQRFLAEFWDTADVEIKGNPAIQQGIRFNIFHLLQSAGRDGMTNIAAKGLTGEGYEGHYFWDTETYVIPFFLYSRPEISRKLLEYRYSILDKARERARQMAHPRGALFPWRTINGEECSAYFPGGTAQYHINADIAYAIKRYMDATQDNEFLIDCGAEILFETARLWADLGDFIERKGNRFCINEVTGPDEYSALVNNNCYTNLMAKENLLYAYQVAHWMQEQAPDAYRILAARIGLEVGELDFWKKAADAMFVPYDEQLHIHAQDDSFLDRAVWDFAHTPQENYPLLIHYHPLVIYRYQVCKQADLVLALFLLGHRFTLDEKKRNYDYYEKITTHDSSLSACIFSIVASEIGYHDQAYEYFINTARMDLDDYYGNVSAGIHVANMAGTWMCLVYGFAGMRAYDGTLSFDPYVPSNWDGYSLKVTYRGRIIKVTVNHSGATYEFLKGEPFPILHGGDQPRYSARGR